MTPGVSNSRTLPRARSLRRNFPSPPSDSMGLGLGMCGCHARGVRPFTLVAASLLVLFLLGWRMPPPHTWRQCPPFLPTEGDAGKTPGHARNVTLLGHDFVVSDAASVQSVSTIEQEINADDYGLRRLATDRPMVVVDVGANVGMVSLALSRLLPHARIYALEPHPVTYRYLVHNLRRNRAANVMAFNVGLSRDGRNLSLSYDATNSGGTSAFVVPTSNTTSARTATLAGFLDALCIDTVDLLKLDCEGCEYEVLGDGPDADNFLWQRIRQLRGERHEWVGIRPTPTQRKRMHRLLSVHPRFSFVK